ncbi:nitrate- and nitrite sensing domain-containing protein [Actinophytocola xanthii]|uniref:nitrate- and nitrite sensing domain-containing protein n=1 Tax=Actinophytocola xanthii TaxID=1912961 RepID=UPI0011780679|nr:nitrate- and nitrite sensing domain-containing protein [Actinophytocola xanthii]
MKRAWWVKAAQWRNWPLLVKLSVVLVVPVVGALVLGVLRVQADVALARSYEDIERIATLRVELVRALTAIQDERNAAMRGWVDLGRIGEQTDLAVARARDAVEQAPDLGTGPSQRYENVVGALDLLPYARKVADGDGLVVLSAYNAVTNAVIEFDRALVGRFPDENLTSASIAVNELQAVREQVGIQHAAGMLGVRDGTLTAGEREMMVEADVRLDDNLRDFRATAPAELRSLYESTVTGTPVTERQLLATAARSSAPQFNREAWDSASSATGDLLAQVTGQAAQRLRAQSGDLATSIGNRAGAESVLLLTLVLLAAGIGGVLGRYLVRSFTVLRRTVLDVAADRLPQAVAAIRAGRSEEARIEPVPLHTTEEFGQLARAFDRVNEQAVRSAIDEANLRSDLSSIFQNLSRRSQGLVERQLKQLEQLEQKADDPEQLSNLFRIDHLATRMRRNNENLMVLSGAQLTRRFTESVPLTDILRAAVSEVEHYQRALVRSAPGVRIVGYAAGDLIRSVAELIENATTFSPPDSQVLIESRLAEDGAVVVEVLDEGVGMSDADLREANERVAAGGGVDVPISRQMGLFVVGRLTARHGIRVTLNRRADAGLSASMLVPTTLVAAASAAPTRPARDGTPVGPLSGVLQTSRSGNGSGPSAGPGSVVAVEEVAGRLELAGIHVRLHDLPLANTPASILFTAQTPVDPAPQNPAPQGPAPGGAGDFTWLNRPLTSSSAAPQQLAPPPPSETAPEPGPGGLPKRVPRGQLLAPPANPAANPATNPAMAPTVTLPAAKPPGTGPTADRPARDAARARGFLSSFQAGIRDSQNRKEER